MEESEHEFWNKNETNGIIRKRKKKASVEEKECKNSTSDFNHSLRLWCNDVYLFNTDHTHTHEKTETSDHFYFCYFISKGKKLQLDDISWVSYKISLLKLDNFSWYWVQALNNFSCWIFPCAAILRKLLLLREERKYHCIQVAVAQRIEKREILLRYLPVDYSLLIPLESLYAA